MRFFESEMLARALETEIYWDRRCKDVYCKARCGHPSGLTLQDLPDIIQDALEEGILSELIKWLAPQVPHNVRRLIEEWPK